MRQESILISSLVQDEAWNVVLLIQLAGTNTVLIHLKEPALMSLTRLKLRSEHVRRDNFHTDIQIFDCRLASPGAHLSIRRNTCARRRGRGARSLLPGLIYCREADYALSSPPIWGYPSTPHRDVTGRRHNSHHCGVDWPRPSDIGAHVRWLGRGIFLRASRAGFVLNALRRGKIHSQGKHAPQWCRSSHLSKSDNSPDALRRCHAGLHYYGGPRASVGRPRTFVRRSRELAPCRVSTVAMVLSGTSGRAKLQ